MFEKAAQEFLLTQRHRTALVAFLRTLFREDWVVYAKRPFGGPEHVLHYLARYTHRVAISNHRIVDVTDTHVTFRWKDYAHVVRYADDVDLPYSLGSIAAQGGFVAAVENTAPSKGSPVETGGASAACKQHRWQRARPLVPREGQGLVCRAFECVLQIARAAVIVRGVLA